MPTNFLGNRILWTLVIVRAVSLFCPPVNVWVKANIDNIIAFELVRGVVFEWVRLRLYSKPLMVKLSEGQNVRPNSIAP